jgi:hypothetical protein
MSIEGFSAELLRRSAGRTLSLKRLHATLQQELGPAAGTYHQLQYRLKQARNAFLVLERSNPLGDEAAGWPENVRSEYITALDCAGLDLSPIVSLVVMEDEEPRGLLGELERTLKHLSERVRYEPGLEAELVTALAELPVLEQNLRSARPPTTARRDPRAE